MLKLVSTTQISITCSAEVIYLTSNLFLFIIQICNWALVIFAKFSVIYVLLIIHRGQNSKQINVAKYVSKFLMYGAIMLDKCVKGEIFFFVHCPFLQSQAK